jgi:hypothetical protein
VAANPAQNALLKMMVPRQVVGALIGKQGSNLKAGSTEAWRAGWSRWFFVAISVFCNCATEDIFGQLFSMDVQPSAQMEKQKARPWLWLNTSRMISCYFQVWDSGNNLQLW